VKLFLSRLDSSSQNAAESVVHLGLEYTFDSHLEWHENIPPRAAARTQTAALRVVALVHRTGNFALDHELMPIIRPLKSYEQPRVRVPVLRAQFHIPFICTCCVIEQFTMKRDDPKTKMTGPQATLILQLEPVPD
jgi:hypothetical protein